MLNRKRLLLLLVGLLVAAIPTVAWAWSRYQITQYFPNCSNIWVEYWVPTGPVLTTVVLANGERPVSTRVDWMCDQYPGCQYGQIVYGSPGWQIARQELVWYYNGEPEATPYYYYASCF